MRAFAAIVIAASVLSCSSPPQQMAAAPAAFVPPTPTPPPQHAPICARPPEKQALEVSVLMSELQVITITCHTEDKYNTLIPRLRPALETHEKSLETFFTRAYGKRAQTAHDGYITELANLQSQQGLRSGDQFCRLNSGMFDEVMPLSTTDELATYAAGKPLQQAMAVDECPTAAPKPVTLRSKQTKKP